MFLRRAVSLVFILLCTWTSQAADLFGESTSWKYFKPFTAAPSPDNTSWRMVGFDDSSWLSGDAPFFYEDSSGYSGNTDLTDMRNGYTCIYLRKSFQITNPAADIELQLNVRTDDGCVVWINGVEVDRVNVPAGNLAYNATANGSAGEPNVSNVTIPDAVSFLRNGENIIAIQALNASLGGSSDFLIAASLSSSLDVEPPYVATLLPPATATVRQLFQIEVFFNEPVTNVQASDLLINQVPAESVEFGGPDQFLFTFPQPPTGTVQVAWASGHGITDLSSSLNPFAGGSWTYTLDPNAEPPGVIISEFMASNGGTLNDEDGDSSDWIELYNAGTISANLGGWSLTDDATDLTKWRFPAVTLLPNSYLVIFASGKNKTSPTAPLHTSFQLSAGGEYLALVDDLTNVVSEFAPTYPAQITDVSYGRDRANPTVVGYFPTPTPGGQNTPGGTGFAPEVEFSRGSSTFTSTFNLSLSTTSATAVIRYTLNGSIPTESSSIYSTPLNISATTRVRTRAFEPGLLPGPVKSQHYIRLDTSVQNVSSDLPLMILHNFGGGSVPASGEQFVVMQIFEPKSGRSRLLNAPDLSTRGRFRLRGSSTQGIAKGSFAFESWDEFNDNADIAPLGMPPESDWVLYAPNQFDPVLIHNSFMYELSNDVGRYAPRTRFVEVYLKDDSGTPGSVVSADYNGIYLLEEKIKRDRNRVDIDKLEPEHTQAPEVTGGYLLKIDRRDPGDSGFSAGGQSELNYVDPKEPEIELPQRDPQQQYIISYINAFGAALNGANYTDPVLGYAPYIDIPSFIDHHILNVLSENADAFRLSTYLYKPRNGKLEFGPIWDFDRSLESKADNRDDNPSVWHDGGTDFFNYTWWGRLLSDVNFWQAWIDRWQEWQDGPLALEALHAKIDRMADEVREAQVREQSRWSSITAPRGTYQNEVNIMKNWLAARLTFINSEFLARPVFSSGGGEVDPGFQLAISAPEGGTIYYTLNGDDPRAPGGGIGPGAMIYSGPVTIGANARVVARAFDPNHDNLTGGDEPRVSSHWSGRTEALFVVARPALIVSEIMYHPAPAPAGNTNDADNFEFIELKNVGGSPINLNRFRFTEGISFDFSESSVPLLQPGTSVVVVKNLAAFTSRYGAVAQVAGEYEGTLDNGGERLVLVGPVGEPVHDFSFKDGWYPVTDGGGFSLVIADEQAPRSAWGAKSGWRISGSLGGSPGREDGPPAGIPLVLINEALTHTDLPQIDAVELYNSEAEAADVSGWFLTDDLSDPRQYSLPVGSVVPGHGYLVIYETNFNANPGMPGSFSLSSKGEQIYLFSGDGQALTGYAHGFEFGAAANGVSFGRHTLSTGQDQFPAQTALTLGGPNAGPRIGPVVVSEIMYHPPAAPGSPEAEDLEFIELHNFSTGEVPLFDPAYETNTWRLREAVAYVFPKNISLAADERIILVGFNPQTNTVALNAFKAAYGLTEATRIFGPFEGRLNNASDSVELVRPDTPEPPPDPDAGFVPYILVDQVRYADATPWPLAADGVGSSLQRLPGDLYGNDPEHWVAAAPTAGGEYAGGTPPTISAHPVGQTVVAYSSVTFSVKASGMGPFRYQWRFNGVNITSATNEFLIIPSVQPSQAGNYQVVVLNAAGSVASKIAGLNVLIPATILQQPQSTLVNPGESVTFTIQATSNTPISYQWRKDGVPLAGKTGTSLGLANVQEADAGFYDVVVTDGIGSVVSAAAYLGIWADTQVIYHPLSQTVVEGGRVTLSVEVRGTLPMSYRWRHNNATVTNAMLYSTRCFLTIPHAQLADGGNYNVVLTNAPSHMPGLLTRTAVLTVLTDTDKDGLADIWETEHGFNPNDPGDATEDTDEDGMTNWEESVSGTDPRDAKSYLKISKIEVGLGVELEFVAQSNRTYAVDYCELTDVSLWRRLADVPASPTNRNVSLTDVLGQSGRIYRLATPLKE